MKLTDSLRCDGCDQLAHKLTGPVDGDDFGPLMLCDPCLAEYKTLTEREMA